MKKMLYFLPYFSFLEWESVVLKYYSQKSLEDSKLLAT